MTATQTFRTSPGTYVGLCGVLSLPVVLGWWGVLFVGRRDLEMWVAGFTALFVIAAVWLAYLRLRLSESGIEYRDLFGKTFSLHYSEISSLKSRTIPGRFSGTEWTLRLHDGRSLRVNLQPFPREALEMLRQRVSCDA